MPDSGLAVRFTVELKLGMDEFPEGHPELPYGAQGESAGTWKVYPYGWRAPEGFPDDEVAAMTARATERMLIEVHNFVRQQYRTGEAPTAWKIKDRSGTILDQGTAPPPEAAPC